MTARAARVEEGLGCLPSASCHPSAPGQLLFSPESFQWIFPLPVWLLPEVIWEGFPKAPTWLLARGPSALCSLMLVVPQDKGVLWAILPALVPHVSPALAVL